VVALPPPIAALAPWMAGGADTAGRGLAAALAMTVPGLALVSRHQRALTHAALRAEPVRTLIAFGAGPLDLARAHLRSTSTAAAAMLGSDLPILLTAAFVAERAAGLDGLGAATAAALERRDLAWLMALALLSCTAVGLAQILSDALLGALDPRLRAALIPHQEGLE
jgi:ABC-type dipeptide/oligopeptide/nickel transport system permease component